MNFVKSALLSAATLGALATFSIGSVSADQTSSTSTTATASSAEFSTGTTPANFNLTQGGGTNPGTYPQTDKGALSLTSVPNGLDFGSHAIGDLQTDNKMKLSKTDNSNLTVQDYRGYGTDKTWKVSAKLSQFAPQSGDTTQAIDATLNANFGQASGPTGISKDAQTVFESTGNATNGGTNATNGVGTKTATLSANDTNLTIAPTSLQYLQAAKYTGTVTWTLTNTAN